MEKVQKRPARLLSMSPLFAATLMTSTALAAPLKGSTSLPLTGDDLNLAKPSLAANQLENFANFIKGLDVLPDHANPKPIADVQNRAIKKIYYVMPFFQASEARGVVGGQEISDQGIQIIAECLALVESFDYQLSRITQLTAEVTTKSNTLSKLQQNLPKLTDPVAIATTKELIDQIKAEIASLQSQIAVLEATANAGIDSTSVGLKQQVVGQLQLKLSFLGVTPTYAEAAQLRSNTAADLRMGISTMIARAVSLGQFGYRSAVFESGYTQQQKDWIALYRRVRPDVQVSSLLTNAVFARATALTSKETVASPYPYFLGSAQVVNAPRLFLAVNGGSNGACGNTKACNVTLEYTWLGAMMAKTSRSGAVTMPIYFEGDVTFAQPDFAGSVTCDFTTGFKVQGRADVKDGAIIYDGDVTNKINYSDLETGACNYTITKGDANSAAYYTIKRIYDSYMALKTQRAAKSHSEMERYREFVNNELQYHARKSQQTNFDFWSLTTWTNAFGGMWGTVASFVVGSARSFYWHTRIEDTSVQSAVKFTTTISESNIQKTERFAFDGFPVLCWKIDVDGMTRVLAACPASALSDYQDQADTDLGKDQQACGTSSASADCVDQANQNDNDPVTDDNGVIVDPWA